MKPHSRSDPRLARGATLIEVLVVASMAAAILGAGVMLLESWIAQAKDFRARGRRFREHERLVAAMADDLWHVRDVRVEGRELEVVVDDVGKGTSSMVYRLEDDRVVRTVRDVKGKTVRRDTFLMSVDRRWRWEVERKGKRFLVRCGASPAGSSESEEDAAFRLGVLVLSGRFSR